MIYNLPDLLQVTERLKQRRSFLTCEQAVRDAAISVNSAIFRCDVERALEHHLAFARELALRDVPATMYFHTRRETFDPEILKAIQDLGHEIGFHHECLDRCGGNMAKARELFLREVELFREHGFDLATVCSHGEAGLPKAGYRSNWELFQSYPELLNEAGVLAEVYLWVNDQDLLYASDVFTKYRRFRVTLDQAQETDKPLMILTHPHRWHRRAVPTIGEVVRDVRQHASNRLFRKRMYDLAY